jgi:hypothetical protein
MEERIKECLKSLMDGINRSDGAAITRGMDGVEALLAEGRATLHPQLVHFLERRSYPKALQFLGGDASIPAGSCGGRP